MLLSQRSAIVTGSTSGIGLGIARAFAEQGADVMLNGFGNADEIEFIRAELERLYSLDAIIRVPEHPHLSVEVLVLDALDSG